MAVRPQSLLPFLLLGASTLSGACNTGAVGTKECREIEYVRCEASPACEIGGIVTPDDVAACKRFYKGQCLHGIAGPVGPAAQAQKDCVAALNAAAACAQDDARTEASTCADLPTKISKDDPGIEEFTNVCDVIGRPWDLAVCDFMLPSTGEGGSKG